MGRRARPSRCLSLCFIFEFQEHWVRVVKMWRISIWMKRTCGSTIMNQISLSIKECIQWYLILVLSTLTLLKFLDLQEAPVRIHDCRRPPCDARPYSGLFVLYRSRMTLCRTRGILHMTPVIRMVGNLEVTHVLTQVWVSTRFTIWRKDFRACESTWTPVVFTKDRCHAWPSLPTWPVTERSIGRQGPPVWTGLLGTCLVGRHD